MRNVKMIAFAIIVLAITVVFGNIETAHAQTASMEWNGTVDDVVLIRIRNQNVQAKTISGRTYNDDNFSFYGRVPRRNTTVSVDKRDGRGLVFIVQQPNRSNNFTTFVQIVDKKGGPDRYQFTLNWN
jgi:Flp pilus assembly protein TadG